MLGQTGAAALNQAKAIYGLGGIGKTQTAIEYAYRYFYDQRVYEWVFWVKAETDLSLATDLGGLAEVLQLPIAPDRQLEEKVQAVLGWLEANDDWLLIFDNADRPELVKPYRPRNPRGRVLLTSRAQAFDRVGIAAPIEVRDMSAEEAIEFLFKRSERIPVCELAERQNPDDWRAADRLAQALGYLPLALEQAAAYLYNQTALSVAGYFQAYRQRQLELLERQQPVIGDYPASVKTTWDISFQAVAQTTPAAVELLRLSAFLAADEIPQELLTGGAGHLGELLSRALAAATDDPLVLPDLLSALTRYSLIRTEQDDCYSIHRMVQAVLRDGMGQAERQQWLGRAVEALNEVFPSGDFETWQQCKRLVTQVQAIDAHLEQISYPSVSSGRLLIDAGYYLHEQGRYPEAEPLLVRSLSIYEQQLGEQHPNVAQSLNSLALLYRSQGRYSEADPLFVRSISIYEQQLGEQHPSVAASLNNLAALYESQERYSEAEPLFVRSLSIREQQLGKQHPDVAQSLNNLAALYCSQGHYTEAESLFVRSFSIWEQQLGEQHPDVAQSLNNLAELYKSQGRYSEAEPLLVRSLSIKERQLGKQHPDVAVSLNNLAGLYYSQRRYSEAEPLFIRSLVLSEQQLGEQHPDVAQSLNSLAVLYYSQRRYSEAEPLLVRSLSIRVQQLGKQHPLVAQSLNSLAVLYDSQGHYAEAELLYVQALATFNSLGKTHPDTQTVWRNFLSFLQQVIQAAQTAQLSNHPITQGAIEQLMQEK